MPPLRQHMIGDMRLKGLTRSTQDSCVATVRQLAAHYHRNPRVDGLAAAQAQRIPEGRVGYFGISQYSRPARTRTPGGVGRAD